ncbi:hypothetical protein GOP47_0026745 [Adiantum capillus-veneris]|nr:hypothetical protein GOP47_0026745 [Adiantum capillus-veneris]
MDPFNQQHDSPASIGPDDHHLATASFDLPLIISAHEQLEAQQLLQQIGWTYYTVWKEVRSPLPGLVRSRGDVNEAFAGTSTAVEHNYQQILMRSQGYEMGLVLQRFYQQCRLLPLGLGIAGRATRSRQHQWASGNELLQQINALSSYNHQPAPFALQTHGFQTIVCVPLQKNAGVLEIGTTELVPESGGSTSMLPQYLLEFTNTIDTQLIDGGRSGSRPASLPSNNCRQYSGISGEAELKQNTTALGYPLINPMQIYRSTAMAREPSLALSSYLSSSSLSSSSPSLEQTMSPSPATQPSFSNYNDEMLRTPTSCDLQAAPMSMVTSFNQLDILNQTGNPHTLYGSSVSIMPSLSLEVHDHNVHDPAAPSSFYRNQQLLFHDSPTFSYFSSSRNVMDVTPCRPPLMPFLSDYMPQQPLIRDQFHISHQLGIESSDQNAGNAIEEVKDGSSAREQMSSVGLGADILGTDKRSNRDLIMQMQGSTSNIVNPAGSDAVNLNQIPFHAVDNPRPGWPQSKFVFRAFQPWILTVQPRMKKPNQLVRSNINTNKYSVKQILRIRLPQVANMMNAEGAAAGSAANFVLMRRQLEAEASLQNHLAGSVNVEAATHDQSNEAASAKQHMFAERNRRRKQGDCISLLRTLVPNITKRDKVTILERTIEYLKEVQSLVHDLQRQNDSLQKSNTKDLGNTTGGHQSSSQNIDIATTEKLAHSTSLFKPHASCEFYHSSQDKQVHPHFELGFSIELRDVDANAAIINIVTALDQKKLQCIDLKMELDQNSNYLLAKIVAQHKDGENNTPTSAEIHDIKQWWAYHVDRISK